MNKIDETRYFVLAPEHSFPHKPGMLSPTYKQAAIQYPIFSGCITAHRIIDVGATGPCCEGQITFLHLYENAQRS